jgi:hypothetical protein
MPRVSHHVLALQSNGSGPRYIALMIARRAGSTSAVRTVVMSSSSIEGSGSVRAIDRPSSQLETLTCIEVDCSVPMMIRSSSKFTP